MHQLDRGSDLQRAALRDAEEPRARQHQEWPEPLARRQGRVAHGLEDPGLETLGNRDQPIEGAVGEFGGGRQRLGKRGAGPPEVLNQGPPAPS